MIYWANEIAAKIDNCPSIQSTDNNQSEVIPSLYGMNS